MQCLVEPRDRGHDRRPRFEHIGGERLGAFGKIDLRADRNREHFAGGMLVGVRQRQKAQEHLVAEPELLEYPIGAAAVRDDVAVGRHDALRDAAGSRGVDQAGGVIGLDRSDEFGGIILLRGAAGQHLFPGQQVDCARLPRSRLDRNHGVHGIDLIGRREDPGREGRLRNEDRACAAVREDVPVVLDGMGHIGRDGNRPGGHDRQIGDDPFRPVFATSPTRSPRRSERSEAERQPADVARRRRPADGPIPAVLLGPQKRLVAEPSRLRKKHRRQAAAAVVIHASPSSQLHFYGVHAPGGREDARCRSRGICSASLFHTSSWLVSRRC